MKIAQPPAAFEGAPANMIKQTTVTRLCYSALEDTLLAVDEPTVNSLYACHSPEHVDAVLNGKALNGFHNRDYQYVQHALQSCSALYVAAVAALQAREGHRVACAPVSGFHHAGWEYCSGYCTFNGLMMTAVQLSKLGLVDRMLVIDGDAHYGDGTEDIIQHLALTNVDTLHLDKVSVDGDALRAQRTLLNKLSKVSDYDLVLYQAGADAHIEDPYMQGYLTDAEWRARDTSVFAACHDANVPLVWDLAGGYGRKTIHLHMNTFESALRVYEPESYRLMHGLDLCTSTVALPNPDLSDPE